MEIEIHEIEITDFMSEMLDPKSKLVYTLFIQIQLSLLIYTWTIKTIDRYT